MAGEDAATKFIMDVHERSALLVCRMKQMKARKDLYFNAVQQRNLDIAIDEAVHVEIALEAIVYR